MLPFPTTFGKFARSVPDRPQESESEVSRRELEPTAPEAHIAWLAGAPSAPITDTERRESRFVSLLVPFY